MTFREYMKDRADYHYRSRFGMYGFVNCGIKIKVQRKYQNKFYLICESCDRTIGIWGPSYEQRQKVRSLRITRRQFEKVLERGYQ